MKDIEAFLKITELTNKLKADNLKLRKLLWLTHGCKQLYGDDGEMQCSSCSLDFKRDSVKKTESVFNNNAYAALIEAMERTKGGK